MLGAFRNNAYEWHRVAELSYDAFLATTSPDQGNRHKCKRPLEPCSGAVFCLPPLEFR